MRNNLALGIRGLSDIDEQEAGRNQKRRERKNGQKVSLQSIRDNENCFPVFLPVVGDDLDTAILELERETRRLREIKKWTETIKSNSGKVLDEVAKMTEGVQKQVECLRQTATALRSSRKM